MNYVEELKALDVNDVGRWPLLFRVAVIAIVFVVVLGLGVYWTIVKDKAPQLARAQEDEQTLRVTFENKQRKAANYDAYKAQLSQIEQSFGTMLRQLPGETEIPSLIVDISQTGLASGKAIRATAGNRQGLLRRKANQDPAVGRLPRDRQLRQRRCRLAAYRDAAQHQHHARNIGCVRRVEHRSDRKDLSLSG